VGLLLWSCVVHKGIPLCKARALPCYLCWKGIPLSSSKGITLPEIGVDKVFALHKAIALPCYLCWKGIPLS
jgi:hypothetical protein